MDTLNRLSALLPEEVSASMDDLREHLTEVRVRVDRPVQLRWASGERLVGAPLERERVESIAASLMDHSLYALERELGQGYFTMEDGCRVGVCGRMVSDPGGIRVAAIGAIAIRICRAMRGCADALFERIRNGAVNARSTLILSAPGMGKTTCLRELARLFSEAGHCVAIADERRELAACRDGVPTLDVGARTDVMDGLPKAGAIMLLVRAMSPEIIVTDEIGAPEDAEALSEAARCGVGIIASAHAAGLQAAMRRLTLARMIREGAFSWVVELGGRPGRVEAVYDAARGELPCG